MNNRRAIFAVALCFAATPLFAANYALLVGVGKYLNGIHPLDGPVSDVGAMRDMLLRNGYAGSNIHVLLNEEGTRPKVVQALKAAVAALKSGDRFVFYYSGHGTSAFDSGLQWLSPEIGPDSGALATYDLSLSDAHAAADTLIIGKRDLRPILIHVPQGAQALVVLDACYSENSAKSLSIFKDAPVRGINLVEMLQSQPGSIQPPNGPSPAPPVPAQDSGAYPYTNVVSLAAASKDQPAIDINVAVMQSKPDWRTVDGKPHGALTNALLDALSGKADTNHDGNISYDEMFRYVRRNMEKYPHQPQLLSAGAFSLDQTAFGAKAGTPAADPAPVVSSPGRVRIAVQPSDAAVEASLRSVTQAEIAASGYDLLVRREGDRWSIYDSSGVLIQHVASDAPDSLALRVKGHVDAANLRRWTAPSQRFNVRIDAEPEGAVGYEKFRTVFRVGEKVRFRIASERPAYLLLLNIDKDGRVTVLFPGPPARERELQAANKPVDFVVEATAPPGSEQMKLIGFTEAPPQWAEWSCSANACPSFAASDARMGRLMEMLRGARDSAEASLRVITQQ